METVEQPAKEVATRTVFISLIFMLLGGLLIAMSVIFGHEHEYLRDWSREVGVVVFSVFTVSLVYERLLAEKHLRSFRKLLRGEIEQAEKNAAACTELGIVEIFSTRDVFESRFPLNAALGQLGPDGKARFVAVSLFHVMNKAEFLRQAIKQGASIELCMLDPEASRADLAKLPDLEPEDLGSALAVFRKRLADWVSTDKPIGRLELRFHRMPVPESFTWFASTTQKTGVWDLSFGRDLKDKRILIVDLSRSLGTDLRKRFDFVFDHAKMAYLYEYREVKVNVLPPMGVASAQPSN